MFVFDLDDTLCFDGATIHATIRAAIREAAREHPVAFASARHPRDMAGVLRGAGLDDLVMIGCNGAMAMAQGGLVFAETLPAASAAAILAELEERDCAFLVDGASTFARGGPRRHARIDAVAAVPPFEERTPADMAIGEVVKILVVPFEGGAALQDRLAAVPGVAVHAHRDGSVDVTALGIDKYSALRKAGLPQRPFVAFGDDANDRCLLERAEISVRVGDNPRLALAATHTVLPGVGRSGEIANLIHACRRALARA